MELEKEYYGISETAKMFNVTTSLLRYWEKEFPQIKPYKNKKGDRYFTKKDINTIQTIYNLTKVQGYTLQKTNWTKITTATDRNRAQSMLCSVFADD